MLTDQSVGTSSRSSPRVPLLVFDSSRSNGDCGREMPPRLATPLKLRLYGSDSGSLVLIKRIVSSPKGDPTFTMGAPGSTIWR